jgi:hypothetical protein
MFSLAHTRAALVPRHGGQIVESLVTMPDEAGVQFVYRWSGGDVIEVSDHGAYVSRIDQPKAQFIDVEQIERAGDEWPDTHAIVQSVRNETSNRTETVFADAEEVEAAFFDAQALGELATGGYRRAMSVTPRAFPSTGVHRRARVAACDRESDEFFAHEPCSPTPVHSRMPFNGR